MYCLSWCCLIRSRSKKPITCLLLIWHVLGPLKTFISACVRARACVYAKIRVIVWERERERERGRERERERGAIHMLLIHSFFVDVFILLFFFSLLYVQYTCSGFVTKLPSSAVTRIEVSSGLRMHLIWKNVLFPKRCCKVSSEKITLCNNGFLIH